MGAFTPLHENMHNWRINKSKMPMLSSTWPL